MANLTFQLLDKTTHDRASFNCGEDVLNNFLQLYASQSTNTHRSKTFVCVDVANESEILGYYTLVFEQLDLNLIPPNKRRGFAGIVPVLLIARLAVDIQFQHQGVGQLMLMDICRKFLITYEVGGGAGIAVNAKHQKAANYYQRFGFIPAPDDPLTLFLPVGTIQSVF